MNSTKFLLILIAITFLSVAEAAQVYGTLTENNRAMAGLEIKVSCNGDIEGEGSTNDSGSYSVRVEAMGVGFCKFKVPDTRVSGASGEPPEIEIYLYEKPSRYDFNLTRNQDGTYQLEKR